MNTRLWFRRKRELAYNSRRFYVCLVRVVFFAGVTLFLLSYTSVVHVRLAQARGLLVVLLRPGRGQVSSLSKACIRAQGYTAMICRAFVTQLFIALRGRE